MFFLFLIPIAPRVKGYPRFVGTFVTGRRKRFQPYKGFILSEITPFMSLVEALNLTEPYKNPDANLVSFG